MDGLRIEAMRLSNLLEILSLAFLHVKGEAGQLGGQEIVNRRVKEPPVYVLAGRVKDLLTGARFGHKNGDWIQRANFKGKRVVKKNSITTL